MGKSTKPDTAQAKKTNATAQATDKTKHNSKTTATTTSQEAAANKRRLSTVEDTGPKEKKIKVEPGTSDEHQQDVKTKVKTEPLAPCPTTPVTPGDVKTLGRIPKIKKSERDERGDHGHEVKKEGG